ncbi:MAG: dihydroorotate dehydrogenase [Chloroflexi bacterium]|nr:dihydroorotate dehydrogenase [Chloroflexota bacterium]
MATEITRPGKNSLIVDSPVMPAAGTVGFGDEYKNLVKFEKLGALVTSPVTYQPWQPATGTRVVPLDAGVLVHTGLPNPGLSATLDQYRALWDSLPMPVILHLVGTTVDHVRRAVERLDEEDAVDAIELGLNDDCSWQEAEQVVKAAANHTEKPLLVRLPLNDAYTLARAVDDAGAGAVVIAAPPRGTARDPNTGRLVSGRVYGPLVKPITLRVVGLLANRLDVPVIGAGGIHSQQDARDYLEAGARAVQVDSVTWVDPKLLEWIARDLGGLVLTRQAGALGDEWHPGIGITETKAREEAKRKAAGQKKIPPAGDKR